ncbi:hypothetical protein A176_005328 [Myxococcus hansupus]|uniref:Uncharacterized protein n=1 Tax=Pseudomyxococcus hansupus TaxID=1297742 RepID=A0A0H4WYB7_9BACT|nr:hypothetical protein [Myxococcus hansupus]AKQ68416.1 hypothetical protein A176_005328 [Myxococcus hansupus]
MPDARTILSDLRTWHPRLPHHLAGPLEGPTATGDALLYGVSGYADETLFLYGYCVGEEEHCFFYDTPWDELHRALGGGHPPEWYDGLEMPCPFRVRYAVAAPSRHEILDAPLSEMMTRPLRYVGTRPAVPRLLTAGAEAVLRDIEDWEPRLRYLRRGHLLESGDAPKADAWTQAVARFGGLVGHGDATFAHYRYEAGGRAHVFAVKCQPPLARMTPSDHAPFTSRKQRREHLALARRQEQGFRLLEPGQLLQVKFNPADPGAHVLGPVLTPAGPQPFELAPGVVAHQLEPVEVPRRRAA